MSEPTNHPAGTELGRWEWVALPEFGIACIKARIDTASPVSTIQAVDVAARVVEGEPYLRFRVFPLPDDPQTFVVVEARRGVSAGPRVRPGGSHPLILTELTIGDESFPVSLEVVESPADYPVTLGRDALGRRFKVDSTREAVAGPPSLGWKPRRRRTRRRPRPA
jgi:hypothetical protein